MAKGMPPAGKCEWNATPLHAVCTTFVVAATCFLGSCAKPAPVDLNIGATFATMRGHITKAALITKDVGPWRSTDLTGTRAGIGAAGRIGIFYGDAIVDAIGLAMNSAEAARQSQGTYRYTFEGEAGDEPAVKYIVYGDTMFTEGQCVLLRVREDSRGEFYLHPHKASLEASTACK